MAWVQSSGHRSVRDLILSPKLGIAARTGGNGSHARHSLRLPRFRRPFCWKKAETRHLLGPSTRSSRPFSRRIVASWPKVEGRPGVDVKVAAWRGLEWLMQGTVVAPNRAMLGSGSEPSPRPAWRRTRHSRPPFIFPSPTQLFSLPLHSSLSPLPTSSNTRGESPVAY